MIFLGKPLLCWTYGEVTFLLDFVFIFTKYVILKLGKAIRYFLEIFGACVITLLTSAVFTLQVLLTTIINMKPILLELYIFIQVIFVKSSEFFESVGFWIDSVY